MRKILFIILFFLLWVNQGFSARYGNHPVAYNYPGATGLSPNWNWTFCNDDWNWVAWKAVALNNSSVTTIPHWAWPLSIVSSWTMRCLYWDQELPTVWYALSWWTTTNDTWTNWNVTASITCSDTWWSWCNSTTYQYRTSSTFFTCDSTWTWTNWSNATFNPPANTNLITYICFRALDVAWNWYSYSSVATIKIDKKPPTLSDITNTNPTNLLANDSYNYWITIWVWWGAPISSITWNKENRDDEGTTNFTDNSAPWSEVWDIRKVDNFILSNQYRDYSFTIWQICDQAWNCWTINQTYNHKVFATTNNFSINKININEIDDNNIADWVVKNLDIWLFDTYWNKIVPASLISRTVDFRFDYDNYLYQNQYLQTWNWVYSTKANLWTYNNTDFLNSSNSKVFLNEISSDWFYNYKFRIFSPTYWWSNWQEYLNIDNTTYWINQAKFNINDIKFRVNWSIWAIWYTEINDESNNDITSVNNIKANYKPIFYTNFEWNIIKDWIVEWTYQSWIINIIKNPWTTYTTTTWKIYIEFWSWNSLISPKIDQEVYSITTWSWKVWEWYNTLWSNKLLINGFSVWTNNKFDSLVYLTGWMLEDLSNLYISSHISYTITWPSWNINIIYNSNVIWKSNYFNVSSLLTSHTQWLKVLWKTHSTDQNDLSQNQNLNDIHVLWNIEKSSLKQTIVKNVYSLVKNLEILNWTNKVTNIKNLDSVSNWWNKKSKNILYFWGLNWTNVEINSSDTISWRQTIVAVWWNIYIKQNIIRDSLEPNAILWIIAIKDENWKWWNIYVDPSVKIIEAALYADKSLISYDWANNKELDGNTDQAILKHQLYIYWSVFSENTIGWSRVLPNPICPYYVVTTCDLSIAQKYDLNYVRRYYVNVSWTWWVNSWENYFNDYNWTKTNYYWWGYPYYEYPIVIKYNPSIQTSPPPFFENN